MGHVDTFTRKASREAKLTASRETLFIPAVILERMQEFKQWPSPHVMRLEAQSCVSFGISVAAKLVRSI